MKLLKDGKRVIASNLCGIHIPINGMYVVYNTIPEAAAPNADASYFTQLRLSEGQGYARIPVTSTKLDEDGKIAEQPLGLDILLPLRFMREN